MGKPIPGIGPIPASFIAPTTAHQYYFPPDAGVSQGHMEQHFLPSHAHSVLQTGPPQSGNDAFVYGQPSVIGAVQRECSEHLEG